MTSIRLFDRGIHMAISSKLAIGAVLVAIGLAGLVYSLPVVSNAAASKATVYQESDVPKFQNAYTMYIPIVIASVGVLTGGIALMAIGLTDTFERKNEETAVEAEQKPSRVTTGASHSNASDSSSSIASSKPTTESA
jgi:hypothetical protein